MQHLRFALALAFAAAVAACAGTQFKWEDVERVKPGMTEAEVVAILGPPYSRAQADGKTSLLIWTYAAPLAGGARSASFRFVDGKVAGSSTVNR